MKPKKTILCVDDNEQHLSIRKVLLETRGYRVIACTNGTQALEAFRRGGVDLVLSDLVMPNGIDGSQLIGHIKTLSPHTPAILISGRVKIYERDSLADVFLPKGMYEPAELLERIRLLLIRKRGPKRTAETSLRRYAVA
jgi:CheY-like chemotaxis protein